ncbi:MAG: hypothetical protein IJZ08_02840 [Clostridia bacterium]|nr:hypothetical protein [Clostridia bacterium]
MTILVNIAAAVFLHDHINISEMSLIPLILIALMIFQAQFFKKEKTENGFRTAYGSPLTAEEENELSESASVYIFAAIPLMIPFVLFFPPLVKTLSVLLYIGSFMLTSLVFRIKRNKKEKND